MKLLNEIKAKEMMLYDVVKDYTGAEREIIQEQIDSLMPDVSSVEFFNDGADDLQEVLLGHDQPNALNSQRIVHTDRIFVFPVPRGCGDMKVVLMAN